ncbi:DUF4105 domain-containing protein [Candidatus Parabeggiatoa sp. HSG14]|uniref:Lnb N-terminal periplasmic domain-containing protein n=1 Tax=Candidatus Parabeggiatoa sp. HSG14 TaxID=3055593 RepID=UPI0032E4B6A0
MLFFFVPTLYAADLAYLQSLVERANSLKLAEQREWLVLLHYKPSGGGFISEVDDPQFFIAPHGKTNPQVELEATLKAFFALPMKERTQNQQQEAQSQHPQCAFIARYHWLKQQLSFDSKRLPAQPCLQFEKWLAQLQPVGLSLIFPTAYLNNPSSMFGHTLLRIDQENQDEQTRLLAKALNYAASTEEKNGLLFAIKGILGGYHGLFSMLPYYKKVKEYSDIEHRNVWEYPLDFTLVEIHRLLQHVWELDKIYFDYYFFDENCAYHLLSLLEVARPTLHLREQLPPWVIPGDTVRTVIAASDLVKQAIFRPASATRLRHRLNLLSPTEQDWVQTLAEGSTKPDDIHLLALDITARTKILETAYDYSYYQHTKTHQSNKARSRRLRKLLIARSRLPSTAVFPPLPNPPRPEQGHASFRLTAGFGTEGDQHYQSLHLRPAYHDLLDPEIGYIPGAQINFLDLSLRHKQGHRGLSLEGLTLIDIVSLTPRDRFFQPLSWKINTGLVRRQLDKNKRSLVYRTNGGAGLSYNLNTFVLGYAFLESSLDIGGVLQHDYALGVGGNIGLLVDVGERMRMRMYAMTHRFELGYTQTVHEIGLEQRFTLTQNNALHLQWNRHYFSEEQAVSQIELSWHWYF